MLAPQSFNIFKKQFPQGCNPWLPSKLDGNYLFVNKDYNHNLNDRMIMLMLFVQKYVILL